MSNPILEIPNLDFGCPNSQGDSPKSQISQWTSYSQHNTSFELRIFYDTS